MLMCNACTNTLFLLFAKSNLQTEKCYRMPSCGCDSCVRSVGPNGTFLSISGQSLSSADNKPVQQYFISTVFKVSVSKERNAMCWHSCNADSNPALMGPGENINKNKITVYPKDLCQSIAALPVIPGTVGSAWGTVGKPHSPLGLQSVGLLIVLFPLFLFMVHS